MNNAPTKVVAFLEAEPAERARAAVAEFNSVAARTGLNWIARQQPPGSDSDAALRIGFESKLPGVEHWDVAGGPFMNLAMAGQVAKLIERLQSGKVVVEVVAVAPKKVEKPKKLLTAKVGRETAGRRGKGVTTIFDLALTMDELKDLATILKQKCGTGGTAKDGRIEIQGDHRDRIVEELENLGYQVKRAGG